MLFKRLGQRITDHPLVLHTGSRLPSPVLHCPQLRTRFLDQLEIFRVIPCPKDPTIGNELSPESTGLSSAETFHNPIQGVHEISLVSLKPFKLLDGLRNLTLRQFVTLKLAEDEQFPPRPRSGDENSVQINESLHTFGIDRTNLFRGVLRTLVPRALLDSLLELLPDRSKLPR